MTREDRDPLRRFMLAVMVCAVIAIVLGLMSCNTIEAIADTPIDFWVQAESILIALWEDLWSIVSLIL